MTTILFLIALGVTPSPNTLLNKSVVGKAMDRDAAAPALVYGGKPSYGVAGAANTAGGNVALLGANGLIQITGVTKAGTTGDTVTINYLLMSGAAATAVVLTEGVGAGQFDCAGAATDAACVANFCATFNANTSLAGYLYCNYTAATETAAIVAVEGMVPYITSVVASDGTNFVLTRGVDGQVLVNNGTAPTPGIAFSSDTNNGLFLSGADNVGLATGGTTRTAWFTTSIANYLPVSTTSYFQAVGGSTSGYRILYAKGAMSNLLENQQTVTFSAGGDASKTTTGGFIPLGAQGVEITGRVIVADTSAVTLFDVGDGTDADLYANDVPADTLGQTFGPTIASYGPTAQIPGTQITAAGEVTVTAVGGSAEDLSIRLTAHYRLDTPDTAN